MSPCPRTLCEFFWWGSLRSTHPTILITGHRPLTTFHSRLRPVQTENHHPQAAFLATGTALLLVDVINDLEFPGGEELLESARLVAGRIAALKRHLKSRGIPAIYVNEAATRWVPSFSRQVEHCLAAGIRGRPVVETLRPDAADYFVLMPQHSPCLLSKLDTLFETLRLKTLIVTGIAASVQARLAANDVYLSGFRFLIPGDCLASRTDGHTRSVLEYLRAMLGAEVLASSDLMAGFLAGL